MVSVCRKLPRQFGKQLMQLKKSVQGIRSEIESVAFDTKHAVDAQHGQGRGFCPRGGHGAQVRAAAGRTGRQRIDCRTARKSRRPAIR